MDFINEDYSYNGEFKVTGDGKKEISFNKIPLSKNSLLSEYFKTVLFCPEEIEIIKGEKELRREFLDDSISVLRPNYVKILRDYNKCLKQKNTLLKKGSPREISMMIDIWNQRMTEYGSRLFMYRGSFIKMLEEYAKEKMEELTDGKEKLTIKYVPSVSLRDIKDVEKIKEDFREKTDRLKNAEIEKMQALTGPHKDDVEFLINKKNVKLFGSQGQQRSVIICLKLAMTEIIKDRTGSYPVLLLDDIMSELDKKKAVVSDRKNQRKADDNNLHRGKRHSEKKKFVLFHGRRRQDKKRGLENVSSYRGRFSFKKRGYYRNIRH